MAETKFDICSRALTAIGANVITSFDDGTTESIVSGQHYQPTLDAALETGGGWRFATTQEALNRLTAVPVGRWSYAFQLPGDLLLLKAVTRDDCDIIYDRYEDMIYTNEDDNLVADYVFRPTESRLPAYFTKALVAELASVFAVALAKNRDLANDFRLRADGEPGKPGLWAKARTADSQQQTTRRLQQSRLVSVRTSGRSLARG